MKIAIDITRAIVEQAGIGRYTAEIVKHLIKNDHTNQYLLFSTHFRDDARKSKLLLSFKQPNTKIKRIRIPGNLKESVWGWSFSGWQLFLEDADILFAPSFFEVNLGLKIPQIVVIHDMSTFLFPEQRGREVSERHNQRVRKVCKKVSKIIAVSENTQKDIIKLLDIDKSRIGVVYPGLTKFAEAGRLPNGLKSKSYILTVGTIEPRKNLLGLLTAYSLLPARLQQQYPLIVAGAQGWNAEETMKVLKNKQLAGKIKFLGFVPDDELAKLYQKAAVFIYPSLYEGFGLPVIEAMSAGTPVITSNISSLPEAAGKAAILVDPNNPSAIATALKNVLENQKLAAKMSQQGINQAKKFSWDQAALEIIKILEEAHG